MNNYKYYYHIMQQELANKNDLNKNLDFNVANGTRKTSFPNICYMLLNLFYIIKFT